jgi:hypothetical protein
VQLRNRCHATAIIPAGYQYPIFLSEKVFFFRPKLRNLCYQNFSCMKKLAAVLFFAAGFGFIAYASLSKNSSSKQATEKKTDKQESKKECKRKCMYS